jgi:transmembrane sensor
MDRIWEILSAKLSGEQLTAEDSALLEDWLNEDSANLDIYCRLAAFYNNQRKCGTVDVEKALKSVKRQIAIKRQRRIFSLVGYFSAAAAAIVFGFFVFGKHDAGVKQIKENESLVAFSDTSSDVVLQVAGEDRIVLSKDDSVSIESKNIKARNIYGVLNCLALNSSSDKASQDNVIHTPVGGNYRVVLSDGTQVWLNSDSYLSFPSDFSKDQRKVKLLGEAFFKVSRSEEWPFIVETDNMDVRVLGTCFDVKAYTDDEEVYATLVKGSVRVISKGAHGQEIELSPSEQFSMNKASDKQIVREVDPDVLIAWTNNMFAFKNQPLAQVFSDLSHQYRIEYRFADAGASSIRISGNIEAGKGLQEIINMIDKIGKVSIKYENGEYVIKTK